MTEQHHMTDMENLWLDWSRANQDLWNRLLQSWIETETFAQLLGKAMQNYLTMHDAFGKALQEYMVQALQTMKIASADDITRLAEMIINLENKVDQLADEVEKASKTTD